MSQRTPSMPVPYPGQRTHARTRHTCRPDIVPTSAPNSAKSSATLRCRLRRSAAVPALRGPAPLARVCSCRSMAPPWEEWGTGVALTRPKVCQSICSHAAYVYHRPNQKRGRGDEWYTCSAYIPGTLYAGVKVWLSPSIMLPPNLHR